MKLSWIFGILLLVFVAVFSVQNAGPIAVRFLGWEGTMSAALVIQLAALLGGLVGLTAGFWARRAARREQQNRSTEVSEVIEPTIDSPHSTLDRPADPHAL